MLVEPITIDAASPTPALSFKRIRFDGYGSEFVDEGGNGFFVNINNTQNRNNQSRTFLQMLQKKNATDPYSGLTREVSAYAALTIMRPAFGFTDAEIVALVNAHTSFRTDTDVTTLRLIQRQS